VVGPAASEFVGASFLSGATVCVEDADETLSATTDYSYDILVSPGASPSLRARSVYGALYAMESFVQLFTPGGVLKATHVELHDAPAYSWRGLMIDSGRRFFPVPVVQNLLDTLQAAKLNVLHLHASDHCRFGVESLLYPNLTAALTGVLGGFYSQASVLES
jgi:hexosaminidase